MKKLGHLSSFRVSFLSYDPEIVQKSAFFTIFADLRTKSKSVKAIFIYASERSRYTLSENGIYLKQ